MIIILSTIDNWPDAAVQIAGCITIAFIVWTLFK